MPAPSDLQVWLTVLSACPTALALILFFMRTADRFSEARARRLEAERIAIDRCHRGAIRYIDLRKL
jgi:hypothetical protein